MISSFFGIHNIQPPMSQLTARNPSNTPPRSPSSDDPHQDSPSQTPPLSTQHAALHAATNDHHGGHRSFLDVIFDVRLGYDQVRASILQGLTTADFDNMRQACRSIDHCLMMPSAAGSLRYPPDLVDKCHETGLPEPPSLRPGGTCPNPPQSAVRIRTCQYYGHNILRYGNLGQTITSHSRDYLVCEVCRRNWHDNIGRHPLLGIQNPMSRHDYWRVLLAGAHITVCSLCDQEQKDRHFPQGHDGCVCYHEYYKKWWLCQRCDILNGRQVGRNMRFKTDARRHLKQVGKRITAMPQAQGPRDLHQSLSWCPCGRRVTEPSPPSIQTVPTPWPGNHNLVVAAHNPDTGLTRKTTKQCVLCCGYVVPPLPRRQPTRRSARLADRRSGRQTERKHTMLGRSGKAATRNGVNKQGFEVRGRGGWN